MPSDLHHDFQNSAENLASISEIFSVGSLSGFPTSGKDMSATTFVLVFHFKRTKCAIFVNRSTTTMI